MKKSIAIILTVTGLALAPMTSQAEEEALFSSQSLTPETALKAATAALQKCRADGYQVAVAVTDRSGLVQALLRDRFAGAHTIDTATRKAWTSASFRTDTVEIVAFLKDNPQQVGIYQIGGAMMVGGGKVIDAAGSQVGAIGVSGGPNGVIDEVCAAAGVAAIELDIQF
ncbi:MAG TPA: heme-binding protein [Gammaproteobacteria bacterium]